MRKAQREIYATLIELAPGGDLCSFCHYARWSGGCVDAEMQCEHPLSDRLEEQWGGYDYGKEPGDDCWGYRPELPLSDIADVAGILLAAGSPEDWSWWREPESKQITVGFRKEKVNQ